MQANESIKALNNKSVITYKFFIIMLFFFQILKFFVVQRLQLVVSPGNSIPDNVPLAESNKFCILFTRNLQISDSIFLFFLRGHLVRYHSHINIQQLQKRRLVGHSHTKKGLRWSPAVHRILQVHLLRLGFISLYLYSVYQIL